MSKWIINNSGSTKTYMGIPVADEESFEITLLRYPAFASCEDLVVDVGAGTVDMSVDGTVSLSTAKGLELLIDVYPASKDITVTNSPAFADKTVGDKSLYSRMAGKKYPVITGSNTCIYTVPFAAMKFSGIEIINAEVGDEVDLYILDKASGTPYYALNLVLNQFGYEVYLAADYFRHESNYDADLFIDMQIKAVYESASEKDIYINYILHEVK